MDETILTTWVIYKDPPEYPGLWVALPWVTLRGNEEPVMGREGRVFKELEAARAWLSSQGFVLWAPRVPDDPPAVFETWL